MDKDEAEQPQSLKKASPLEETPSKEKIGISLWGDRNIALSKKRLDIEIQFCLAAIQDTFVLSALASREDLAEEVALFLIANNPTDELVISNVSCNPSISKFIAMELVRIGYAPNGYFKKMTLEQVYEERSLVHLGSKMSEAIASRILTREIIHEAKKIDNQEKLMQILISLDSQVMKARARKIEAIYGDIERVALFVIPYVMTTPWKI
jgi:hypothetical protein